MIPKHERIFKDNIISYITNRIQVESKDAVIADEVMNRFPVWIGMYKASQDMQKDFISWLVYGIRQTIRLNGNNVKENIEQGE